MTSRAPLRLAAEHELALGPLAAEPAVALFLRRARAVDPRLQLEPGDDRRDRARSAAASTGSRWRSSSPPRGSRSSRPPEILDRLSRRLDLLSAGPRDAPAAPADAARRDRLELRPARPGRPAAVHASSACSPAASRSRPPRPSAAWRRSTGSPRSPTTACSPAPTAASACSRPSASTRSSSSRTHDAVRDRHARAYVELMTGAEDGLRQRRSARVARAPRRRPRQPPRGAPARDRRAATATPRSRSSRRCGATGCMRGGVSEGRELCRRRARARRGHAPEAAPARVERRRHPRGRAGRLRRRPRALRGRAWRARVSSASANARRAIVSNLGVLADLRAATTRWRSRCYEEATDDRARARRPARRQPATAEPRDRARRAPGNVTAGDRAARGERRDRPARRRRRRIWRPRSARSRACCSTTTRQRALALLRLSLERAHEISATRNAMVGCLETAAAAASRPRRPASGRAAVGRRRRSCGEARGTTRQPDEQRFGERVEAELRAALGADGFAAARGRGRRARARRGRQPGHCESKEGLSLVRFAPASGVGRGRAARRRRPPTPRAGSRPRGRRSRGRRTRLASAPPAITASPKPQAVERVDQPERAAVHAARGSSRCSRIRLLVLNRPFAAPVKPNVNSANPRPGRERRADHADATPPRPAK